MKTPLITRRQQLSLALSQLEGFTDPDPALEQVVSPPEAASALLWEAFHRGDLSGKHIVDLGCGPGRLAIGAALLGARTVSGLDQDGAALAVARRNAASAGVRVTWHHANVMDLPPLRAETVLMNPPFGVQHRGAEVPFLVGALGILLPGGACYFFAGPGSQTLIEEHALRRGVKVEDRLRSTWPFPPTFRHHTQRMGTVLVDRWILRKEQQ